MLSDASKGCKYLGHDCKGRDRRRTPACGSRQRTCGGPSATKASARSVTIEGSFTSERGFRQKALGAIRRMSRQSDGFFLRLCKPDSFEFSFGFSCAPPCYGPFSLGRSSPPPPRSRRLARYVCAVRREPGHIRGARASRPRRREPGTQRREHGRGVIRGLQEAAAEHRLREIPPSELERLATS